MKSTTLLILGACVSAALTATPASAEDSIVKQLVYASCGKDGGIAPRLEELRSKLCVKGWERNTKKGYQVSGACIGPFNQDYEGQSPTAGCVTFVKATVKEKRTPSYTVEEGFDAKFKFLGFDAEVSFKVKGSCAVTKADTCTPEIMEAAKYAGKSVKIDSYSAGFALVDAQMDSAGDLSATYKGKILPVDAELAGSFKCETVLEAHRFVNMESFEYTCKKTGQ